MTNSTNQKTNPSGDCEKNKEDLLEMYTERQKKKFDTELLEKKPSEIRTASSKTTASPACRTRTPDIHDLLYKHIPNRRTQPIASVAEVFRKLERKNQAKLHRRAQEFSTANPVRWETFLAIIGITTPRCARHNQGNPGRKTQNRAVNDPVRLLSLRTQKEIAPHRSGLHFLQELLIKLPHNDTPPKILMIRQIDLLRRSISTVMRVLVEVQNTDSGTNPLCYTQSAES